MPGPALTYEELCHTVEVWWRHGRSWKAAAEILGIADKTMQNRMARAESRGLVRRNGLGQLEPGFVVAGEPHVATAVKPRLTPPPQPEPPRVRVKPNGAAYRVLAIGDAHDSPGLEKDRFHWMGRYAAETRPDYIIQIGDMLTLDSLNSHIPNDTFNGRAKGTFLADIASGKEALDAFNSALPSDYTPKKHCTQGNHERRLYLFEDSAPEVSGMMQAEYETIMADAGWTTTPYGEWFFVGGVGFSHAALNRLGKTYGGINAEQTMANHAIFSLVIGHSHVARHIRAAKIGPLQHLDVVNLGCALPHGHIEEYARHSTTGWWYGCHDLLIQGGHIQEVKQVSMLELERRYGCLS